VSGAEGLPPGVDLVALASLVAPLVAAQTVDPEDVARRIAEQVEAQLQPLVERMEAAARVERRRIGPFVPPPASTAN